MFLKAPPSRRRTLQWSGPGLALLALGRSPQRWADCDDEVDFADACDRQQGVRSQSSPESSEETVPHA